MPIKSEKVFKLNLKKTRKFKMSPQPILITIPKYITIPTTSPTSIAPASPANSGGGGAQLRSADDLIDEFLIRGKKRRLDHLTWEEKFQRK